MVRACERGGRGGGGPMLPTMRDAGLECSLEGDESPLLASPLFARNTLDRLERGACDQLQSMI